MARIGIGYKRNTPLDPHFLGGSMKILLLGATGQIGNACRRSLLPLGEIVMPTRDQLDLADIDRLPSALRAYAPTIIVNAAAYTQVDQAEGHPNVAQQINAEAVAVLAEYARQCDALLLHYSTDYVFDGTQSSAYREKDTPAPLNVYGQSKLAGERAILTSGCRALILRTSWIYAPYGRNFVNTILKLAQERDTLRVVADQIGAPTCADLVANITVQMLSASLMNQLPDGLYHATASGHASWYDVATRTVMRARNYGMPLRLRPENITAIRTEDYPLTAQRPRNSLLDTGLLSSALSLTLPHWTVDLDRTLSQLAQTRTH